MVSISDKNTKWCGTESEMAGLNPCCLEPDHDGDHRFWVQEHSEGMDYGIRTYDSEGKAIQFFEVASEFSVEEVAAIIQYMELVVRKRR